MVHFSSLRLGKSALRSLDGAVAALAAASLAFLVYAMPASLFSGLIAATGLPSLIPAAEPPLGMKARFAVIAVVALLCFFGVWALLRAVGRLPRTRKPRRRYEVINPEAPRLRRGDAHPDAPPRPPLLAGHDFGEPFESWLTDVPATDDQARPDAADRDAADHEPAKQELLPEEAIEPVGEETSAEPLILSEPLADEIVADEVGPEVSPVSARARERAPAAPETLAAFLPEAAEESVSNLMQRLEGGLALRKRPLAAEPELAAPPADAPAGHRLRSAISELERMAKRS